MLLVPAAPVLLPVHPAYIMRSYLVLLLKIYIHQFELAQLLLYKQILQCQVLLILLLLLHLLLLLLLSLFLKNGRHRDNHGNHTSYQMYNLHGPDGKYP